MKVFEIHDVKNLIFKEHKKLEIDCIQLYVRFKRKFSFSNKKKKNLYVSKIYNLAALLNFLNLKRWKNG